MRCFINILLRGFSGGVSGKESACQCKSHKRCEFDPWISKIPWRSEWQPPLSNILAWEILWAEEEPGRLQSMGLQVVRHD